MKERKIYTINDFKGLDTENKQTKVSPARATKGENFVIDSNTIKTRKGLITAKEILLQANEKILGSYKYQGAEIFLTNEEFYVKDDLGTYSTRSLIMYDEDRLISKLYTKNVFERVGGYIQLKTDRLNYNEVKGEPMFKEEKNALFIFCIGMILIFSIIGGGYVLYELKDKPEMPYERVGNFQEHEAGLYSYEVGDKVHSTSRDKDFICIVAHTSQSDNELDNPNLWQEYNLMDLSENVEIFNDLPTPYTPTLFIGKERFEDVNLLSNKSKYKLFAETQEQVVSGMMKYTLPTHYEESKHTSFSVNANFYKGKFDDLPAMPQYLGIIGEDLTYGFNKNYEINEVSKGEILDIFKAKKEFVYDQADNLISYGYGLTAQEFYKMRLSNGKTTFEFLTDYLKENVETITNVNYFTFNVPVEYLEIKKDANGNITSQKIVKSLVKVYTIYTFKIVDEHARAYKIVDKTEDPTDIYNYMGAGFGPFDFPSYFIRGGDNKNALVIDNNQPYLLQNRDTDLFNMTQRYIRRNLIEDWCIYIGIRGYQGIYDDNNQSTNWELFTIIYRLDKISESLYSIEKSNDGFDFRVRDLFFDYAGEPAIEIEITFEDNPDYELIADSAFGIEFANRLFLAGNTNFPNIDRYNVSNDLLGEGEKSQSYELSYFPSKNFNVLGGKSPINGYVVATDTVMYITKVYQSTDFGMFVRIYDKEKKEFFDKRTNIKTTPLNHKCLVRYANDILMLTNKGLFAIELSQNIATDERLITPKDELVNGELVEDLEDSAFLLEDNRHLYIVLGDVIFFVDNRYGYEFVKWTFNAVNFTRGMIENEKVYLLDNDNRYYTFEDSGKDILKKTFKNGTYYYYSDDLSLPPSPLAVSNEVFEEVKQYDKILLTDGYFAIAEKNKHYSVSQFFAPIQIIDDRPFKRIKDGYCYIVCPIIANTSIIDARFLREEFYNVEFFVNNDFTTTSWYFIEGANKQVAKNSKIKVIKNNYGNYIFTILSDTNNFFKIKLEDVKNYEVAGFVYSPNRIYLKSEDTKFNIVYTKTTNSGNNLVIQSEFFETEAIDVRSSELESLLVAENVGKIYNVIDAFTPELNNNVFAYSHIQVSYSANLKVRVGYYNQDIKLYEYNENWFVSNIGLGKSAIPHDFTVKKITPIQVSWRSAMLDFGNYISEKTLFKVFINATREGEGSKLYIAKRTMRNYEISDVLDFSKPFDDTLNYEVFGYANFDEVGMSLPFKENNFLYIQLYITATGKVNVNSISFLYKNNRMVKSIG